jgi:hypothetical protein
MPLSGKSDFYCAWVPVYVSFVSMDTLCRAISYGSAGQFENPCRAN